MGFSYQILEPIRNHPKELYFPPPPAKKNPPILQSPSTRNQEPGKIKQKERTWTTQRTPPPPLSLLLSTQEGHYRPFCTSQQNLPPQASLRYKYWISYLFLIRRSTYPSRTLWVHSQQLRTCRSEVHRLSPS